MSINRVSKLSRKEESLSFSVCLLYFDVTKNLHGLKFDCTNAKKILAVHSLNP